MGYVAGEGYDWEMKVIEPFGEGLFVPGFESLGLISIDERPDFWLDKDIDAAWMELAVDTGRLQEAKQKFARLLLRHNGWMPGDEADVIGRIFSLTWVPPFLNSDIFITEPSAQGMAARGELPSRSAEFKPDSHLVWGLSMIKGAEGQFDEEWPDFVLRNKTGIDDLRKLSATPAGQRERVNLARLYGGAIVSAAMIRNANRRKPAMPDQPADTPANDSGSTNPEAPTLASVATAVTALQEGQAAQAAVQLRTVELLERLATPAESTPADGEETPVQVLTRRLSESNVLTAQLKVENWVQRNAQELLDGGCPLTRAEIRKQLLEPKTDEGRQYKLEALRGKPALPSDDLPAEDDDATIANRRAAFEEAEKKKYAEIVAGAKASGLEPPCTWEEHFKVARRHAVEV